MGLVRVFLALCVVLVHCGISSRFIAGHLAVQMFFIISGFYMALVLNEKYTEASPIRFYVARYLRLWPTYIVVLALSLAFWKPFPSFPGSFWTYVYFYFSTFSLFGHDTLWLALPTDDGLMFQPTIEGGRSLAAKSGMQHMWSVGVELVLYAFAPIFARNWRLIVGLAIVAFGAHCMITLTQDRTSSILLRTPIDFFWPFLLGMIAYWSWRLLRNVLGPVFLPSPTVAFAGVVAASGLIWLRATLPIDVVLCLFALVIIPLFQYTKSATWDRFIGELSYPIYVVHWPFVVYHLPEGDTVETIVVIVLTLVAAVALHWLVAVPVDMLRSKLSWSEPPIRTLTPPTETN